MALNLYNTLTRKKEVFKPISDSEVKMYCCGPTVYNYAHIGNLRTYIFEDFLRRVLEYNGYDVNHVMNVTDVGHLTDDADSGEDKMAKGAKREKKTVLEIADFYTEAFFNDIVDLNITSPTTIAKATEHIKEMQNLVRQLETNGFTYEAKGNVYYDISKFKYYTDLGRLNLEQTMQTDRIQDDTGKKNKHDFVLWFTKSKFQDQALKWDSPWGTGYPGWHLECSAMAAKYLGSQFDIHCGGVDHIQVHHTNEIAQSEAAFNVRPWVRYWIHGEFLVFNKGKMSKSDGTFITLQVLKDKGYEPLLYRFFCINSQYRQKLNFSYEALDNTVKEFDSLKKKILAIKKELKLDKSKSTEKDITYEQSNEFIAFQTKFVEAINDDLNLPKALGILNEVLKSDLTPGEKLALVYDFDKIFALNFEDLVEEDKSLSEDKMQEIQPILDNRAKAREEKNWELADKLRDELKEKGFAVKDTQDGQIVEQI